MRKTLLLLLILSLSFCYVKASVFTVTTTSSWGPGSLREAIRQANQDPSPPALINFNIEPGGLQVIKLDFQLPYITAPNVVLDGTSQPGWQDDPLIVLDGSLIAGHDPNAHGITLADGAHNTVVKGLVLNNGFSNGIVIHDANNTSIQHCFVGTDESGLAAVPNIQGILIHDNCANTTIKNTIVAGNKRFDLVLPSTAGCTIAHTNKIGINKNGEVLSSFPLKGLSNIQLAESRTASLRLTAPPLPEHEIFTLECSHDGTIIGSCELPAGTSRECIFTLDETFDISKEIIVAHHPKQYVIPLAAYSQDQDISIKRMASFAAAFVPSIHLTASPTIVCSGGSTELNASIVGITPFTVEWSDGFTETVSSSPISHIITPSTTTIYSAKVTDALGNQATSNPVTITVNDQLLSARVTSTRSQICVGESVQLTAAFTSSNLVTLLWSDGVQQTNVFSPVVRTVAPTNTQSYYVTVIDSNGCKSSSAPITIQVNKIPSINLIVTSQGTCSQNPSSLMASFTGTSPFKLQWSDGLTQTVTTSPVIRTVTPQVTTSYSVKITDGSGCTATSTSITLPVEPSPSLELTASPKVICTGGLSVLTASSSSTEPFTLQWSDGLIQKNVTSPVTRIVFPTSAITYQATLITSDNCKTVSAPATITLQEPSPVSLAASPTESFAGETIKLTLATEALAPFTVRWSDGLVQKNLTSPVTRLATPTSTTTYQATVIANNGCQSTSNPVTITVASSPTVTLGSSKSALCSGDSITLIAQAVGAAPLSLTWSDGLVQGNITSPVTRLVSPESTTTYWVKVTDRFGISTTSPSLTIVVNNNPSIAIHAAKATLCAGESTTLDSLITGAAPFTLDWSDGVIETNIISPASRVIAPASSTEYTALVTDSNNCQNLSNTVNITVNSLPTSTLSATPSITCTGNSSTLTLTLNGLGPFTVTWSDGLQETGVVCTTSRTVTPETRKNYYATIQDAHGCISKSNTVTISVNNQPTVHLNDPGHICLGDNTTLSATVTGTSPYTLTWSDGVTQTSNSSPITRTVSPHYTTIYTAQLSDAHSCKVFSNEAIVKVRSLPSVTLKASDKTIHAGQPVKLTAETAGYTPLTLKWSDGVTQENVCSEVSRVVHPHTTTTYNVTIVDARGCHFTPEKGVKIKVTH